MQDRRLTKREKAWLDAYLSGEDATNAARIAGYKDPNASGYDLKHRLKPTLEEALDVNGVNDALVTKVLRDAMLAMKVVTAQDKGIITDEREYADHTTRIAAVDRYLKITGKAAPTKVETKSQVQIVEDATTRLSDDAVDARLAELEQRDDTE